MQSISSLINYDVQTVKSRRTRRGDLIDDFLAHINPGRLQHGLKPLGPAYLSRIFADRKMDCDQMYCFFKDCERAKNFSSYFWFSIRPQKLSTVAVDED